jgi:tetratricopeptide (TPR) repeat protein
MKRLNAVGRLNRNAAWFASLSALVLLGMVAGCSTGDQTPAASAAKAAPIVRTDRNYEAQMPPRAAFDQYLADLQQNPSDYIARTKVIQIYPTLDPRPVRSPDADVWVGQAKAAMKSATGSADYYNAANAYFKANTIAPWVGAYYYNAAVACEKAGDPSDAAGWLYWYLMAAPNDPDAPNIRQHMGELQYAADQAARFQAVLKSVAGRTWTFTAYNGLGGVLWRSHIVILNGQMVIQLSNGTWVSLGYVTPSLEVSVNPQTLAAHWYHFIVSMTYQISPDFSSIIETETNSDGTALTRTYQ